MAKQTWALYDPETAEVDRSLQETECLSDIALDRYWRLTAGKLTGLLVPSWFDKHAFRGAVGNLGRALDWVSKRLGVFVSGVWTGGPHGAFEIELRDVNGTGETASVVFEGDDLYRENVVRRAIFEATGGLTVPDHHCWQWHDVVVVIRRVAEFEDRRSFDRNPITSGHLQTVTVRD